MPSKNVPTKRGAEASLSAGSGVEKISEKIKEKTNEKINDPGPPSPAAAVAAPFFVEPEMVMVVKSIAPLGRDWRALSPKRVAEKSATTLASLLSRVAKLDAALPRARRPIRTGPARTDLESWRRALADLRCADTGQLVATLPRAEHLARLALLTVVSDIGKRHLPESAHELEEELDVSEDTKVALARISERDPALASEVAQEAMRLLAAFPPEQTEALEMGVFLRMLGVRGPVYGERDGSEDSDEEEDEENFVTTDISSSD